MPQIKKKRSTIIEVILPVIGQTPSKQQFGSTTKLVVTNRLAVCIRHIVVYNKMRVIRIDVESKAIFAIAGHDLVARRGQNGALTVEGRPILQTTRRHNTDKFKRHRRMLIRIQIALISEIKVILVVRMRITIIDVAIRSRLRSVRIIAHRGSDPRAVFFAHGIANDLRNASVDAVRNEPHFGLIGRLDDTLAEFLLELLILPVLKVGHARYYGYDYLRTGHVPASGHKRGYMSQLLARLANGARVVEFEIQVVIAILIVDNAVRVLYADETVDIFVVQFVAQVVHMCLVLAETRICHQIYL